jgi:hypothetical protein
MDLQFDHQVMFTTPSSLHPIHSHVGCEESRNPHSLPFDILYQIATSLDDRDFIRPSRTNRALYDSIRSDAMAPKTVEVKRLPPPPCGAKADSTQNFLPFSKEGQLPFSQNGYTYREAIRHRFDIHEAVATAAPYSVAVLAYGTDFSYRQGIRKV